MWHTIRIIAFPFSLVYLLAIYVRNFLYDINWLKSYKSDIPTICIGNLSVGGTGKTPMVEYLVHLFRGHRVAVLSRGYKRKTKGFILAGPESTVEELGDEPFQISRKFPQISLAVDADRKNGISELGNLVRPKVILLDDAFQHRRIRPSLSILLTAHGKLYKDDWYFPTGSLRDGKWESKRAHLIIVTKCPQYISSGEKEAITRKLNPKPHQKVLFGQFTYAEELKNKLGETLDLKRLKEKKVAVVTGIAFPRPFISHLTSKAVQFEHFEYRDHHYFTAWEVQKFNGFDLVLTTEKDYVRLRDAVPNLYYLEVAHEFSGEDKAILKETLLLLV